LQRAAALRRRRPGRRLSARQALRARGFQSTNGRPHGASRCRSGACFPESSVHLGGGQLTWIGDLRPTKLSARYMIRIKYPGQGRPAITVASPRLSTLEGKSLPHVYPGDELCLYFPGQWNERMSIATTIVSWTSEWLLPGAGRGAYMCAAREAAAPAGFPPAPGLPGSHGAGRRQCFTRPRLLVHDDVRHLLPQPLSGRGKEKARACTRICLSQRPTRR
jgi:hypothetical protein